MKRQFKKIAKLGYAALSEEKYLELLNAQTAMESNYAKVRICSFKDSKKCDLQLEPGKGEGGDMQIFFCLTLNLFHVITLTELTEIFQKSSDPEELEYYWKEWYEHAGTPTRCHFNKYVELKKEAALLNSM